MFDDLIREEFTGRQFGNERDCSVRAAYTLINNGDTDIQPLSFGIQKEYDLYLKVGCSFVANNIELGDRRTQAIKQLKYGLFKDIISSVHEALNSTDNSETQKILLQLLSDLT